MSCRSLDICFKDSHRWLSLKQYDFTKSRRFFSIFYMPCFETPCFHIGTCATEGFLTPGLFHSTSLVSWGSSRASKAAEFFKEFDFLGFNCCFSAKIEISSKTSKIEANMTFWGDFWKFVQFLLKNGGWNLENWISW